jgi:hypothetical protein
MRIKGEILKAMALAAVAVLAAQSFSTTLLASRVRLLLWMVNYRVDTGGSGARYEGSRWTIWSAAFA